MNTKVRKKAQPRTVRLTRNNDEVISGIPKSEFDFTKYINDLIENDLQLRCPLCGHIRNHLSRQNTAENQNPEQ